MKCFQACAATGAVLLSLLLTGCNKIESALGSASAVIKNPDQVTPVRMKSLYDRVGTGGQDPPKLHGYPMLRSGSKLSGDQVAAWQALLLDSGSYRKGRTHGRVFSPVMALQFKSGGQKVDVLISFAGKELQFIQDGHVLLHEDFSPAYDAFVSLATRIFPNDEQIP